MRGRFVSVVLRRVESNCRAISFQRTKNECKDSPEKARTKNGSKDPPLQIQRQEHQSQNLKNQTLVLHFASGAEVAVVAGDFPGEENVFYFRAGTYVVFDEVAARRRLLVHNNSDVGNVAAEIPGDEFARFVVGTVCSDRQRFSVAREKDLQVRHAAVVDVGIRAGQHPTALVGIGGEISQHVLVDFFLQVDAEGAIGAYDFVGADAGVGGNIAIGIGNSDVCRIVADDELCALDCRRGESLQEGLVEIGVALLGRGERRVGDWHEHKSHGNAESEAAHRWRVRRRNGESD